MRESSIVSREDLRSKCVASLTEHTATIWGVTYHHAGDFLVSASMDHTAKLWDLVARKCKQTLRGHVDSVNSVVFQPFSNNVATGSGDTYSATVDFVSDVDLEDATAFI